MLLAIRLFALFLALVATIVFQVVVCSFQAIKLCCLLFILASGFLCIRASFIVDFHIFAFALCFILDLDLFCLCHFLKLVLFWVVLLKNLLVTCEDRLLKLCGLVIYLYIWLEPLVLWLILLFCCHVYHPGCILCFGSSSWRLL